MKGKLHVLSFGLSLGLAWGLVVFVIGLLALLLNVGSHFVAALGTYYIGYEANMIGSIVGLIWGFADLFVIGVVIAYLYNFFVNKLA